MPSAPMDMAVRGAPAGYPAGRPVSGYPTAGMPDAYPAGPGAYPAGPDAAGPGDVPPAGELPLYGPVAGPDSAHPLNPAAQPKYGMQVGQIHKAAGGPDRWYLDLEDMVLSVRSMPLAFPLITSGTVISAGVVGQRPLQHAHRQSLGELEEGLIVEQRQCLQRRVGAIASRAA